MGVHLTTWEPSCIADWLASDLELTVRMRTGSWSGSLLHVPLELTDGRSNGGDDVHRRHWRGRHVDSMLVLVQLCRENVCESGRGP